MYEHSCLGFPGVVIRWSEENGRIEDTARIVKNGIIQPGRWGWSQPYPEAFMAHEMELFDAMVRETYANNPDVQG